MKIEEQIGDSLRNDFSDQNIHRLKEWFERFPEAPDVLTKKVGHAVLKKAFSENMWLSTTFLLNQPYLPQKRLQVQSAVDNTHEVCRLLIKSHIHGDCDSQHELLSFLQERARL